MSTANNKILVYGKFRVVHPGHMRLFKKALDLGEELFVGIIQEENAEQDSEFTETLIRNLPFVTNVIVAKDAKTIISKVSPDIVLMGFEHRNIELPELKLIDQLGAKVFYSSGETFLSEQDLLEAKEDTSQGLTEIPRNFIRRNKVDISSLKAFLQKFKELKVVVLGDLIVDEYINCHPIGMSNEDPLIVNAQVSSFRYIGGAGIVAAHCAALGAKTSLVSVVGEDEVATWAKEAIENYGVKQIIETDPTRHTTLKQRFKSEKQTLFRLSHVTKNPLELNLQSKLENRIMQLLEDADAVICSDFSYGVLGEQTARKTVQKAKSLKTFVAADSQSSSQIGNLGKFEGADLICATEREARLELRNDVDGLAYIANSLRRKLKAVNLFLKLGGDGVLIDGYVKELNREIQTDRLPALNRNPVDVSGAGDSMLALSTLSFASGADIYQSALVSSLGAAIQISRQGNIPISLAEIIAKMELVFDRST